MKLNQLGLALVFALTSAGVGFADESSAPAKTEAATTVEAAKKDLQETKHELKEKHHKHKEEMKAARKELKEKRRALKKAKIEQIKEKQEKLESAGQGAAGSLKNEVKTDQPVQNQ